MKHYILNLVMVLLSSFLLYSCGGSTETEQGVIRGTLLLDGQSDNSGITVLLYVGGIVPAEIAEVNSQYPQVAFD